MTKVKICGLTRPEDARIAIEYGADALGFIHEKTSPRYVGEEQDKWVADLPPFIIKVAVFGRVVGAPPQAMYDLVQGVEWETFPYPAPKRLHVLRLRPGQKADDLIAQTINASAILLDAFREEAYGGTGHTVDWDLAAEIVQRADKPVILAGGLNPNNVADAIRRVRPYAVDVSSGVEKAPGIKDHDLVQKFVHAAKAA